MMRTAGALACSLAMLGCRPVTLFLVAESSDPNLHLERVYLDVERVRFQFCLDDEEDQIYWVDETFNLMSPRGIRVKGGTPCVIDIFSPKDNDQHPFRVTGTYAPDTTFHLQYRLRSITAGGTELEDGDYVLTTDVARLFSQSFIQRELHQPNHLHPYTGAPIIEPPFANAEDLRESGDLIRTAELTLFAAKDVDKPTRKKLRDARSKRGKLRSSRPGCDNDGPGCDDSPVDTSALDTAPPADSGGGADTGQPKKSCAEGCADGCTGSDDSGVAVDSGWALPGFLGLFAWARRRRTTPETQSG